MAKVRVYELAKELGVESKTVLSMLKDMGEFVRSASSTVEAPVEDDSRRSWRASRRQPRRQPRRRPLRLRPRRRLTGRRQRRRRRRPPSRWLPRRGCDTACRARGTGGAPAAPAAPASPPSPPPPTSVPRPGVPRAPGQPRLPLGSAKCPAPPHHGHVPGPPEDSPALQLRGVQDPAARQQPVLLLARNGSAACAASRRGRRSTWGTASTCRPCSVGPGRSPRSSGNATTQPGDDAQAELWSAWQHTWRSGTRGRGAPAGGRRAGGGAPGRGGPGGGPGGPPPSGRGGRGGRGGTQGAFGGPAARLAVDASPRSSGARNSIRWRRHRSVASASSKATARRSGSQGVPR